MKAFLFILCLGLFFTTCESATHIDKEAAIEEKVQERLSNYKHIISQKCRKAILEEASAMADSIILERAKILKDSIERPEKPDRPEKPEVLEIKDSLTLAPLFESTDTETKPASSTLKEF